MDGSLISKVETITAQFCCKTKFFVVIIYITQEVINFPSLWMALQYFAAICKSKTKLSSTLKPRNIFSTCSNLLNVEFTFLSFLYLLILQLLVTNMQASFSQYYNIFCIKIHMNQKFKSVISYIVLNSISHFFTRSVMHLSSKVTIICIFIVTFHCCKPCMRAVIV